jgi:hypothetical protein
VQPLGLDVQLDPPPPPIRLEPVQTPTAFSECDTQFDGTITQMKRDDVVIVVISLAVLTGLAELVLGIARYVVR